MEDNLNHCIRKTWFSFLVKRLKVNFVWMSEAILLAWCNFLEVSFVPNRLEAFSFFGGKWGGRSWKFLVRHNLEYESAKCGANKGANFQQEKKNPMNFRGLRRSAGLNSSSGKHATGAMDATLQTPTNATNAACALREREREREDPTERRVW
jgi:hypothetical protein